MCTERSDMARDNSEDKMVEFEIYRPGNPGRGTVARFFVCAACGERITGGDANALFESDAAGGLTGRSAVVHRGDRCDPPGGPFRSWRWVELGKHLSDLLHNSGYDLEALAARQRRLQALRTKIVDDPNREPESFSEMADYLDAGIWTVG
jgi:hypothetical protein